MTSRKQLEEWFERGVSQGAKYMVVVCDHFDYGDYPCFFDNAEEAIAKKKNPGDMQSVMEIYDLTEPMKYQMDRVRMWAL